MSRLQYRASIVLAAMMVALLSAQSAHAQTYVVPGPVLQPRSHWYAPTKANPSSFISGAQYDIINQAKAERSLTRYQARLQSDIEQGNTPAADRHARRIGSLQYRIAVDEWLIRKNSQCNPGPYPLRDDSNCLP